MTTKLFLVLVVLSLGTVLLLLIIQPTILASLNTIYTQDFSYQEFNKIESGMSKEKIVDLLGEPFDKYIPDYVRMYECFLYSKPANRPIPPFAWISVRVCFDTEEKVIATAKDVFAD